VLLKSYPYSSSLHWHVETLVHQSQDLIVCRGLNDELSTTTHDSVAPLFRVRLVSLSSPLYMARSPSLQTTTLAPQAVVTNFTSRLERFSTFSGKLLESSPRLPQVPVLCYASSNCTALFWVCSLTPMASDS
ncbi:unnamed protein product, partial [Brassica rapa]